MANLTAQTIRTLERDPYLYEMTMSEVAAHLRLEQQLADRLDAALRESQDPEESGWIDWAVVIDHFRLRASAETVRDELRRNRRVGLSAEDVALDLPGEDILDVGADEQSPLHR